MKSWTNFLLLNSKLNLLLEFLSQFVTKNKKISTQLDEPFHSNVQLSQMFKHNSLTGTFYQTKCSGNVVVINDTLGIILYKRVVTISREFCFI